MTQGLTFCLSLQTGVWDHNRVHHSSDPRHHPFRRGARILAAILRERPLEGKLESGEVEGGKSAAFVLRHRGCTSNMGPREPADVCAASSGSSELCLDCFSSNG
ncbi:adiponectin receptor protein 2-like, partial [Arapaima gigas]